jgi:hypothetical protein
MSERIIEQGGEVFVEQYEDCRVYDRIVIDNGVAVCYNKPGYTKDIYLLSQIEVICAYTSDKEESSEWW